MNDRTEPSVGKAEAIVWVSVGVLAILFIGAMYAWVFAVGDDPPFWAAVCIAIFSIAQALFLLITIVMDAGHDLNIYARRNYDRKHGKESSDY